MPNNDNGPNKRRIVPEVLTEDERGALLKQPSKRAPTGLRNLTMMRMMLDAGLRGTRVDVAPVTPDDVPFRALVDAAFSFKEQTLRRSGLWEERDQAVLDPLRALPTQPGSFLFVPIFVASGLKPTD